MEPAVKYRLIHQDKHSGARLGELITPHGTFPHPNVYACWHTGERENNGA